MLNVSRNTVKKYLQIYQKSQLDIDNVLLLNDACLFSLFQEKEKPAVPNERYEVLRPLLPEYCKRLKKKRVARQMLHKEYLCQHPDGYARSRFDTFIQQYLDCSRPVMHLEHKAGDIKNGYIRVESHYYSVPCKYIGKKVNVLYTDREVEVYFRYEKIAVHLRSFRSYGYTTREEHLTSQHRFITDWNPDKFFAEAAAIHPDMETYIRRIMEEKKHPEQAYKSSVAKGL